MRKFIGLIFLAVFVLVLFLGQTITLYTDLLWFREVEFAHVFTKMLFIKVLLGLVFGGLFFLILYINIKLAARLQSEVPIPDTQTDVNLPSPELIDPLLKRLLLPGTVLLGFMAAPQAAAKWKSVLLYFNSVPFGIQDPLFNNDIGFYIFRLPALESLYGWFQVTLALVTLATAFVYYLYRSIQYSEKGLFVTSQARTHLFVLLATLLLVQAGGYFIDAYKLLYSPSGVVFGASYSDIYANLPALRLLTLLALVASGLCLFQIYRPGFRYLFTGLGALFLVHIVGLYLYPSLLQRFWVTPNELVKETPYIKKNILLTRQGYGIDKVETQEFPAEERLTAADLRRNDPTIKNIRLWDHTPLLATYAQLQQIRTYYEFVEVDNDRYMIDGTYRQVMLSARELSHEQLPSRIWINEHLIYTHGYGVVFGPVNQVTREGLPEFFIKDIPPVSTGAIKVTRPEIYYGELANDYVFVKTKAQELDYPAGDQNVYTNYEGRGGVPLRSFLRKLLFSARFATLKISLSNDITAESRILYYRHIQERVKKIAPFLTFDRDAYLVIDESGRLFWIIDAYTTSHRYPYSEPTKGMGNYIRNSVKAVVDAYNGVVSFYISDPEDPVVRAYGKAFPGLFKPLEAMPEDLRVHIRYPQDLFNIQARIYTTYHMQDPQVFYNKEDLLSIPRKTVEAEAQGPVPGPGPGPGPMRRQELERDIDPYYLIMRLPGEKKEEYVLLLPFTPNKRDNMRSWLAARSDGDNYGKLIALNFPKAKLVYGPKQIDARIDQDAIISQKLTLWGQGGSQVIRGSLLAIPIENSLLYVQPLYLAAEKGSLPELKRVITAFGNRIAMERTLKQSLARLFEEGVEGDGAEKVAVTILPGEAADLPRRALELYNRSLKLLREGNWSGFGEEQKRLEEVLKGMQNP
ncbi:MAG: UPF0182 family protein [Deltaproteobacteria bacterium]|nr:UPF0182 family protein [Deltaproteobacteria bacterium]